MATTKLVLDTRGLKSETGTLKIRLTHKRTPVMITLDIHILPSQWDDRAQKVIGHPQRNAINSLITRKKLDVDAAILELAASGVLNRMTAVELKNALLPKDENVDDAALFSTRFLAFARSRNAKQTQYLYTQTHARMNEYDSNLARLRFEDITADWLAGFDRFLSATSPSANARAIHMRNIRSVFNEALDDEITSYYPFRKFKIKTVPTIKRSLSVEDLRVLFDYPVEEEKRQYLDMFKLMFFLIGINSVDLLQLKEITRDGRVEYYRAKTGRLYSIKVEPEALDIIERYRGKGQLLNPLDRYKNYRDYAHRMNENLQKIGSVLPVGKHGGKEFHPLFPEITTYYSRHTWATIAASLDIPKETISAALGHEIGSKITSIYIDFDQRKVDEANRRVIDWVLYGKK